MESRWQFDLMDRLDSGADRSALDVIANRLETGHGPARLANVSGLDPADFLAAIAFVGLGTDEEARLPLVHAPSLRPSLQWAASEPTLAEVFPHASRPSRLALAAGLLQVLDCWDASHEAAQEADDLGEHAFSPYWHAIAHRREPDPGNAAYWLRRVGRHEVFDDLAERVRPILEEHGDADLAAGLLPNEAWNPQAFVAFCGKAATRRGSETERLARRLQRVEMLTLLEATAAVRR